MIGKDHLCIVPIREKARPRRSSNVDTDVTVTPTTDSIHNRRTSDEENPNVDDKPEGPNPGVGYREAFRHLWGLSICNTKEKKLFLLDSRSLPPPRSPSDSVSNELGIR